jgi:allantoinase
LLFHAELDNSENATKAAAADPPNLYSTFLSSRPQSFEIDAIKLITELQARYPKLKCHIVHLSAAEALPVLREARNRGLQLTAETCFHYLCLAAEDVPHGHPEFKCCPPIREQSNRDLLWDALKEGLLDMVVSDHSPCVASLKRLDDGDIMSAWGGISTLGLGLSLLWTESKKRGVSLAQIIHWTAVQTAKHAGLGSVKGKLEVGFDGDFVIFNPQAEFEVSVWMELRAIYV